VTPPGRHGRRSVPAGTAYVVRRLLVLVPTWLGIALIAFVLTTLSPGDPAHLILDQQLDEPPTKLA
jgi:ABC-type microcin C transport system permease subunit YejB